MKKYITIFSILFIFSSCANMKLLTKKQYIKVEDIKRIGLLEVALIKPSQAILPLLDAAIFNKRMNNISGEILNVQSKKLDNYRDLTFQSLKKTLFCEIVTVKELQTLSAYIDLKQTIENKDAALTKNDNFSTILLASGEYNIFPLEKGVVKDISLETPEFQNVIKQSCTKLNLDAIAFSISNIDTENVGMLGAFSKARVISRIIIFNKYGNKIGHAYGKSKVVRVAGNDIAEFQILLDEYNVMIDPLVKQLLKARKQ